MPVSVLVVGSVALDSVRTPNGAVEEALGGSASYFSLAARHFTDVQIVAVVGEDFPAKSRELLAASGVDVGGLATQPGRTFRWAGEYGADLAYPKTLATELNVFATFHPSLRRASARPRPCSWPTSTPSCSSKCSIRWKRRASSPATR